MRIRGVIGAGLMLAACSSPANRATRPAPTTPETESPTTTAIARATTTTQPDTRFSHVVQTSVTFTDTTRTTPARGATAGRRERTLRTTVLWPATADGRLTRGPHPLFVFAHGYAVQASTYVAILNDVARAGAIVAAPELPGESTALPGPPNEADLDNEPCDLLFLAKALMAHPPSSLAYALTTAPLVLGGHSDGATAAVAAAYSQEPCAGPRPVAVVAMSPNDMTIPASMNDAPALLVMTGTADTINPATNTERLWRQAPPPAWLVTLDGGSHLGTFTTDRARPALDALIAGFVTTRRIPADARVSSRIHVSARAR